MGIAGVAGNGQSELLEALAGIRPVKSGRIRWRGQDITDQPTRSPRGMRWLGLSHVPEDRQRMGLIIPFSARESAILGYHDEPSYNRRLRLRRGAVAAGFRRQAAEYDVRPSEGTLPTSAFSGGNQQKIVLARELDRNPELLLVGQPTRGVDIGAIEFIHRRLVALRDAGKAILLVSVELDEILALSDRILVMHDGRMVGEMPQATATERAIGLMMAGVSGRPEAPAAAGPMTATAAARRAPRWVNVALVPAANLALALLLSGVVVMLVGENPLRALRILAAGAFGNAEAIGYTLYYATNFVFTGLAVAVAFHGGLFNIGAEGQAYVAGLGVALVCLGAGGWPTILVIPATIVAAAAFGAAWAFVPAWLQARRGSHVVITTIMFNFIAAALMTHLLVNVLMKPGQQSPETREFDPNTWLPQVHEILRALGWEIGRSPLNLSAVVALAACAWCGSTSGTRAGATSCAPWATARPQPSTLGSRPRARSSSPCRSPARWPGW